MAEQTHQKKLAEGGGAQAASTEGPDLYDRMLSGLGNMFFNEQAAEEDVSGGYVVQPGDTLWDISRRQTGDPRRWGEIYDRNKEVIGENPDLIRPGQDLDLGEEEEEVLEEALESEALTPEQQLAAAETARSGLDAQLTDLHGLPEDERAIVMQRVQGLSGDALVREMAMVQRSLAGPNGGRAMHALAGIQGILDEDEDNAERLTPEVVEMLVDGVATRRSDSDRGQEGILGARQARDSANALLEMDDEQYAHTMDLMNRAGKDADGNPIPGADAQTERSLILKAVASREDQIDTNIFQDGWKWLGRQTAGTSWSWLGGRTEDMDAMDEISTFADQIRGHERTDLIRRTSSIDIHDTNDSTVDPNNIAANNDTTNDNDGLFQRFGDSCGPTTSQIVRGETDPMFAWHLHEQGINNPDMGTDSASEQERVLEANGGGAQSPGHPGDPLSGQPQRDDGGRDRPGERGPRPDPRRKWRPAHGRRAGGHAAQRPARQRRHGPGARPGRHHPAGHGHRLRHPGRRDQRGLGQPGRCGDHAVGRPGRALPHRLQQQWWTLHVLHRRAA